MFESKVDFTGGPAKPRGIVLTRSAFFEKFTYQVKWDLKSDLESKQQLRSYQTLSFPGFCKKQIE